MISEREKVLIQRAAAAVALRARVGCVPNSWYDVEAARLFPMPKVLRRKVVTMPDGVMYRVAGDSVSLEYTSGGGFWTRSERKRGDIAALLKLFDEPNERVEETP